MLKPADDTFLYVSLILKSKAKVKLPNPPLNVIPDFNTFESVFLLIR